MNRLMRSMGFNRIVQISRPRFWIYVAGTYALGCLVAALESGTNFAVIRPDTVAFLAYFLLPANLLIYGVNDIFDYETDRLNAKKVEYEALVAPAEHRGLIEWIALLTAPFLVLLVSAPQEAVFSFLAFLLFAVFYSAGPIRAKTTPFLDCLISSSIYITPAVFGFHLAGGEGVEPMVLIAGYAWGSAMHAYSAVPDIEADRRSGTATVATFLGRTATLLFCAALYAMATMIAYRWLGVPGAILGAVYVGVMAVSLMRKDESLFQLYKAFPLLNSFSGMVIFVWLIALAYFG